MDLLNKLIRTHLTSSHRPRLLTHPRDHRPLRPGRIFGESVISVSEGTPGHWRLEESWPHFSGLRSVEIHFFFSCFLLDLHVDFKTDKLRGVVGLVAWLQFQWYSLLMQCLFWGQQVTWTKNHATIHLGCCIRLIRYCQKIKISSIHLLREEGIALVLMTHPHQKKNIPKRCVFFQSLSRSHLFAKYHCRCVFPWIFSRFQKGPSLQPLTDHQCQVEPWEFKGRNFDTNVIICKSLLVGGFNPLEKY